VATKQSRPEHAGKVRLLRRQKTFPRNDEEKDTSSATMLNSTAAPIRKLDGVFLRHDLQDLQDQNLAHLVNPVQFVRPKSYQDCACWL